MDDVIHFTFIKIKHAWLLQVCETCTDVQHHPFTPSTTSTRFIHASFWNL